MHPPYDLRANRRTVLKGGVAAGVVTQFGTVTALAQSGTSESSAASSAAPSVVRVTLNINGQDRALEVDTRTTLLDALRENVGLTGSKKGCDHGQCGACTILVNDRRINSCLALAVMHQGDQITTIEGLGTPEELHVMQAKFIEHDGFQCGYCTSGQICSAVAMVKEAEAGWPSHVTADVKSESIALSDDEIRERMSGNLCRCSCYRGIVAAIRDASGNAA